MEGIIMEIQRFCLQDGPGIRTTVFLKGCNMRCKWCHNPESMEMPPVLMYREEECTGCGKCSAVCPNGVHQVSAGIHEVDRSKCTGCGVCAGVCPAGALSINGFRVSSSQVMEEICRDEKYYASSGGGVTFSGGEATMQPEFLTELLEECQKRGYHTAVETNGLISPNLLTKLIPLVDLFLFDYKITGQEHVAWTGVPGDVPLQSLEIIQTLGGKVVLRCPVIPGINDTKLHFAAIRELKRKYSCVDHVEVMAYHDTGKGKWKECGKEYELAYIKTVLPEQKRIWEEEINKEEQKCCGQN